MSIMQVMCHDFTWTLIPIFVTLQLHPVVAKSTVENCTTSSTQSCSCTKKNKQLMQPKTLLSFTPVPSRCLPRLRTITCKQKIMIPLPLATQSHCLHCHANKIASHKPINSKQPTTSDSAQPSSLLETDITYMSTSCMWHGIHHSHNWL